MFILSMHSPFAVHNKSFILLSAKGVITRRGLADYCAIRTGYNLYFARQEDSHMPNILAPSLRDNQTPHTLNISVAVVGLHRVCDMRKTG